VDNSKHAEADGKNVRHQKGFETSYVLGGPKTEIKPPGRWKKVPGQRGASSRKRDIARCRSGPWGYIIDAPNWGDGVSRKSIVLNIEPSRVGEEEKGLDFPIH